MTGMSIRCKSIGNVYQLDSRSSRSNSSNDVVTRSPVSQIKKIATNDQDPKHNGGISSKRLFDCQM